MEQNIEILSLDSENIYKEHICCALSDKKCEEGVKLKKEWLKQRFEEGYTFKKLSVRGKVFIEYGPAENGWIPVHAPGYMLVNCFWVAGNFKGKGYGTALFNECLHDSRDKNGIIVVVGKSKKPYLSDKSFFIRKGFEVCDTAPPYFELLVKRFNEAPLPYFTESAKKAVCENQTGLTVYYSDQCPYTNYYTSEIRAMAEKCKIPVQLVKVTSKEQAQNLPAVYSTYSVFYNGKFVTHEIMTESKFMKIFGEVIEKGGL